MGTNTRHNECSDRWIGGTTPVPTIFIDRVMPDLRDTELRVLLVIVRQTLGWQIGKDPYLRKERDWLTQSQLMRRTGRASGAVARAIDVLVRRGLIDVLDGAERPLLTSAARRRNIGRLYYRLHKEADAVEVNTERPGSVKSEHAKPHTTKTNDYKNNSNLNQNVDKAVDNPGIIRNSGWIRAMAVLTKNQAQQP